MTTAQKVQVVEVGPRDGFQMESTWIPTELKVEVIDLITAAGVSKVEATSFVHPRVIPQLRDADQVLARVNRRPATRLTALVPNLKGLKRALAAAVDGARLVVCVTEAYNQRNVGMSVARSLEVCRPMMELAERSDLSLEVVLGVAFGCPLEGPVAPDRVVDLAHRFVAMGARELTVADSVGLAHPRQVYDLLRRLRRELPETELSLHLHDTRGLGLANVVAALEAGVLAFDASIGGLGGCPVVAGAKGNIATEDLVNLCHEMGYETGVDLEGLRRASRKMAEFLHRELPSRLLHAPSRGELFAAISQSSSSPDAPRSHDTAPQPAPRPLS